MRRERGIFAGKRGRRIATRGGAESVRLRFCVAFAFQFKTCFPLSHGNPRVIGLVILFHGKIIIYKKLLLNFYRLFFFFFLSSTIYRIGS